jgi:curved DNA-binding protein CbpA
MNQEKLKKYLTLFGLRNNFTMEDLTASYRILAKLNHPDVNKDKNSVKLMTAVNEGYQFIKDAIQTGEINTFFDNLKQSEAEPGSEKKRVEDIYYDQYKKGFIILKSAFEDYYGEKEDKSLTGKTGILKKELLRAKIEFAVLINDLPYNQWVNDAIDKISSINKWLD